MTAPKWVRKRKKAMEYLNQIMGFTLRFGYVSLRSETGKKNVRVNFVKDDEIDQEKFSTFYGVAIKTIKEVYRESGLHENKYSKKHKEILKEDVKNLVHGTLWLIYENWEDYGYEITL